MKTQSIIALKATFFVEVVRFRKLQSVLLMLIVCIISGLSVRAFGGWEATHDGKTYGLTLSMSANDISGWHQDWNAAEQEAQFFGGHLVTIDSAAENDWLSQTFKNEIPMAAGGGNYNAWIGLNYNNIIANGDTVLSRWKWVDTNSNLPSYRNWASGYPRAGTNGHYDYAYINATDGYWRDQLPINAGSPVVGIYEIDHASVVPVQFNIMKSAYIRSGTIEKSDSDTFCSMVWEGSTFAYIDTWSWDNNCRIETNLSINNGNSDARAYFGDVNNPQGGTITIGTLNGIPLGTPLNLLVDVNALGDSSTWNLSVKRGSDTILSMNAAQEMQAIVYAGETLAVDFSNSLSSNGTADLAINWYVVPEPASPLLLIVAGLCVVGCTWHRRK